ncbi:MAG: LysE family transporter [Pseudomonadota bacterium]
MVSFLFAVLLLLGTPGPGVLSLAGVGAAFGASMGVRYFAGLWLGHNLVSLMVVMGLAAALADLPVLRSVLAGIACLYLLWIATKIALAGREFGFIEKSEAPGFVGGLFLQAVNPKAYAVSTTLFAGFPAIVPNPTVEIVLKFAIFNAVWVLTLGAWLFLGAFLKRLNLSPPAQRRINLALSFSLAVVVLLAGASLIGR